MPRKTQGPKPGMRHPLEDWADIMAKENLIDLLLDGAINYQLASRDKSSDENLSPHTEIMTAFVFANEILRKRGHIVRIADEIIDDVISSKFNDNLDEDTHLPWPMFAIEIKGNPHYQALVVSTIDFVAEHIEESLDDLHVSDSVKRKYLREIGSVIEQYEKKHDMHSFVLSFIPSKALMSSQSEHLGDALWEKTSEGGMDLSYHGQIIDPRDVARDIGPIPLNLHWAVAEMPPSEQMVNMLLFVIASNTETRTTYTPDRKLPDNPKKRKRRSKMTMHEVGFEWTDAYRQYREYVRSNPQGGTLRPHTRRGHWHRFRIGPRDGETKYVTHWIPPILVRGGQRANQGHIVR